MFYYTVGQWTASVGEHKNFIGYLDFWVGVLNLVILNWGK